MTVKIIYHFEPGPWLQWWAESPDMPGWVAAATTPDELRDLVLEALQIVFNRDDVEYEIEIVHEDDDAL